MNIELTKEEAAILGQLVFLGNKVVTKSRITNRKPYRQMGEKIGALQWDSFSPSKKKKHRSIDLYNLLVTSNLLIDYQNESCFPTLAFKLVQKNYAHDPNAHAADHVYQEEFEYNGVLNIHVDIPDMEERMDNFLKDIQKDYEELLTQGDGGAAVITVRVP